MLNQINENLLNIFSTWEEKLPALFSRWEEKLPGMYGDVIGASAAIFQFVADHKSFKEKGYRSYFLKPLVLIPSIRMLRSYIPFPDISAIGWIAYNGIYNSLISIYTLKGAISAGRDALLSDIRLFERITLLGFSTFGTYDIIKTISQLGRGIKASFNLDPTQLYFALKHKSIQFLGGNKECRAVYIDGLSSKWSDSWLPISAAQDSPYPFATTLYKNCDVRAYRVDDPYSICSKIEEGAKEMGGPVDILMLGGHSNPIEMRLGPNTFLDIWNLDAVDCLRNKAIPTKQVVLDGCNTATGNFSIAERIAEIAKGREVTGYKAYVNPNFVESEVNEGRFRSFSFYIFNPKDSKGNLVLDNAERTFAVPPDPEHVISAEPTPPSYLQVGAGITSTLLCAYKTYKEGCKYFEDKDENSNNKEAFSAKRLMAFATAAAASLAFTVHSLKT